MGWTAGVQFSAGTKKGFFLFSIISRPALGSNHPPFLWVLWAVTQRVKWLRHKVDHSPLFGATVENAWSYTSSPPYTFMAWC
jgi:hypothetical protein